MRARRNSVAKPPICDAARALRTTRRPLVRRQSFIVQGVETLEINNDLKDRCEQYLRASWARAPDQALHCLLFVNAKLVTVHSKSNAFALSSADIFLLSVYLESIVGSHMSRMPPPPPPTLHMCWQRPGRSVGWLAMMRGAWASRMGGGGAGPQHNKGSKSSAFC